MGNNTPHINDWHPGMFQPNVGQVVEGASAAAGKVAPVAAAAPVVPAPAKASTPKYQIFNDGKGGFFRNVEGWHKGPMDGRTIPTNMRSIHRVPVSPEEAKRFMAAGGEIKEFKPFGELKVTGSRVAAAGELAVKSSELDAVKPKPQGWVSKVGSAIKTNPGKAAGVAAAVGAVTWVAHEMGKRAGANEAEKSR